MKEWQVYLAEASEKKDLAPMDIEIESMSILLQAAVICLADQKPEWVDDLEAAEEVLDMETVYRIIEVCGGIKLNDPEALRAAAMAAAQVEDGTS